MGNTICGPNNSDCCGTAAQQARTDVDALANNIWTILEPQLAKTIAAVLQAELAKAAGGK